MTTHELLTGTRRPPPAALAWLGSEEKNAGHFADGGRH